ncbi:MAG: hypothetical protein GX147_03450 [Deltaproteobacteria bacterium]|jgi:hypothetical protein|nr:hypothetical protein [Deltaproteobacteria bacterium]
MMESKEKRAASKAMFLCFYFWPLPLISGLLCNWAEKKMIESILNHNGILDERLPPKIFWYFQRNNLKVFIGSYFPWVGIFCQLYNVVKLSKFTALCAREKLEWKNRRAVFKLIDQRI